VYVARIAQTLPANRFPRGELVHHALEFGHGQDHDGQMDKRIYSMLSGFAHPSVEMLYATTADTGPISPRLACSPSEAKLLVSTAGREAAAAYDMAYAVCGADEAELEAWEAEFDRQIVLGDR
jgi:hypothetical protein